MGAQSRRTRQAIVAALEDQKDREAEIARNEGKADMLAEILSWLQEKYLDPDLDMTSVEGQAIYKLAEELAATFLKKLDDGKEGGDEEESNAEAGDTDD